MKLTKHSATRKKRRIMTSSDLQNEILSEEWVEILSDDEVLEAILEEHISVDSRIYFLSLAELEGGISLLSSISVISSVDEDRILDRKHREKNQKKKSRISM